jgi:hypothetical protein
VDALKIVVGARRIGARKPLVFLITFFMGFSSFKLVCRDVLSDESCGRLDVIAFGVDAFSSESNDLYLVRLDVNLCSVRFMFHGFSACLLEGIAFNLEILRSKLSDGEQFRTCRSKKSLKHGLNLPKASKPRLMPDRFEPGVVVSWFLFRVLV